MSESPPTTHMDTHTTIADGITYKIARLEATVEYVVRELGDLRRSQEEAPPVAVARRNERLV